MTTHVVQLDGMPRSSHAPVADLLDPAATWLMVAVAGSVLALSLLMASGSVVDRGTSGPADAGAPQPGPARLSRARGLLPRPRSDRASVSARW